MAKRIPESTYSRDDGKSFEMIPPHLMVSEMDTLEKDSKPEFKPPGRGTSRGTPTRGTSSRGTPSRGGTVGSKIVPSKAKEDRTADTEDYEHLMKISDISISEKKEEKIERAEKKMTLGELKAATAKRKEELKSIFQIIAESANVDMAYLLDCTGSMSSYIEEVKNNIFKLTSRLRTEHPQSVLKFAFVRYTDFDMGDSRTSVLDFTESASQFKDFLTEIRAQGGGDGPEDIVGGLNAVINLSWRKDSTKVLVHLADAPCHGTRFHSMLDSYPTGKPGDPQPEQVLDVLFKYPNFHYFFGKINNTTDTMINLFNQYLKEKSTGNLDFKIELFPADTPESITYHTYMAVTTSISCSVAEKSDGKSMRKFVLDKTVPDWSLIESRRVTQTKIKMPATIEEVIPLAASPLKSTNITTDIKIAPNPFAKGGCRLAYHGYDVNFNKRVVLKQFLHLGSRNNSLKRYLMEMDTQAVAAKFAFEFNKLGVTEPIKFAVAKVIMLKDADKPQYYAMEPFIEGTYEKFNSNAGWALSSPISEIMQAFSHWSYIRSDKNLMIVDIQGVKSDRGILLTDPAIHSKNILRYGKTNFSTKGMKIFLDTHKCGKTCELLGLSSSS